MLKNYLLVYQFVEYDELGGGTFLERFGSENELLNYVNENCLGDKFRICFAGYVSKEFEFKPKEKITLMEMITKGFKY